MVRDLETQFERDYKKIFDYIESVIKNYFLYETGEKWEFDFKDQRGYHQIYKPFWKAKGLNIHFEIKLTSDSLINHKIAFLLDIEGSNKRNFKVSHEERIKEKLENVINKNQISYRKGKRADTFAIKEYYFITPENLNDGTTLNDNIIRMIEDFKDFIEVIDQEVIHFHATNEK